MPLSAAACWKCLDFVQRALSETGSCLLDVHASTTVQAWHRA
jgi:hypothetical protein